MKNYYLLLLALSVLLISSCKTFNLSQLERTHSNTAKIPPLEPLFDLSSFGPTYKDLYDIPSSVVNGGLNPGSIVDNMTQTLTSAEDTKRIYESTILRNICESVGETQGYAVCKMGIRSRGIESWVNPLVSVLTLGIANLFGYKYATYEDNLEIYVDIQNLDRQVVASYTGAGTGKAKAQAYKGYTVRGAKRMAHANAFKAAMSDIQSQIARDHQKIAAELAK